MSQLSTYNYNLLCRNCQKEVLRIYQVLQKKWQNNSFIFIEGKVKMSSHLPYSVLPSYGVYCNNRLFLLFAVNNIHQIKLVKLKENDFPYAILSQEQLNSITIINKHPASSLAHPHDYPFSQPLQTIEKPYDYSFTHNSHPMVTKNPTLNYLHAESPVRGVKKNKRELWIILGFFLILFVCTGVGVGVWQAIIHFSQTDKEQEIMDINNLGKVYPDQYVVKNNSQSELIQALRNISDFHPTILLALDAEGIIVRSNTLIKDENFHPTDIEIDATKTQKFTGKTVVRMQLKVW